MKKASEVAETIADNWCSEWRALDRERFVADVVVEIELAMKERAEGITRAEIAEQARLINERDAAREEVEKLKQADLSNHEIMASYVEQLAAKDEARDAAKEEAERLFSPMPCGHPWACFSPLGPADNVTKSDLLPCLACRGIVDLTAQLAEARGALFAVQGTLENIERLSNRSERPIIRAAALTALDKITKALAKEIQK